MSFFAMLLLALSTEASLVGFATGSSCFLLLLFVLSVGKLSLSSVARSFIISFCNACFGSLIGKRRLLYWRGAQNVCCFAAYVGPLSRKASLIGVGRSPSSCLSRLFISVGKRLSS